MEQQTAIEIVKNKLSSAGVKYEDVSKFTIYDLIVQNYKVQVLYGGVKFMKKEAQHLLLD